MCLTGGDNASNSKSCGSAPILMDDREPDRRPCHSALVTMCHAQRSDKFLERRSGRSRGATGGGAGGKQAQILFAHEVEPKGEGDQSLTLGMLGSVVLAL